MSDTSLFDMVQQGGENPQLGLPADPGRVRQQAEDAMQEPQAPAGLESVPSEAPEPGRAYPAYKPFGPDNEDLGYLVGGEYDYLKQRMMLYKTVEQMNAEGGDYYEVWEDPSAPHTGALEGI